MSSARAAQLVHASCCGFAGPWPRQKAHDEAAVEALCERGLRNVLIEYGILGGVRGRQIGISWRINGRDGGDWGAQQRGVPTSQKSRVLCCAWKVQAATSPLDGRHICHHHYQSPIITASPRPLLLMIGSVHGHDSATAIDMRSVISSDLSRAECPFLSTRKTHLPTVILLGAAKNIRT
ncbi:predicted protein [Verticillium alfalfae VaMs.102]|uniref:Predicted protein n=1 Tax=Verticillium alfalfae (strain VaMs.102 / ATCC MYA-4576 / FGSC 10136) TaxID=526221 RepID=C9S6Y5_VERA1|nr:predicted protein [Verticillium alfalfae VaMs.102]EEY14596.1 predicted protein [Verticillium alfalfae VaMs.102]